GLFSPCFSMSLPSALSSPSDIVGNNSAAGWIFRTWRQLRLTTGAFSVLPVMSVYPRCSVLPGPNESHPCGPFGCLPFRRSTLGCRRNISLIVAFGFLAGRQPFPVFADRSADAVGRDLKEARRLAGGAHAEASRLADAQQLDPVRERYDGVGT